MVLFDSFEHLLELLHAVASVHVVVELGIVETVAPGGVQIVPNFPFQEKLLVLFS